MTPVEKRFVVQFLCLKEVEVEGLDEIQAVQDALKTFGAQTRESIVYHRVMNVSGEETEIAQDWETFYEVDFNDLRNSLGLQPGDQISSNR